MAEAAATVFAIASFDISVAKTLHDAANDMINARKQIAKMAKHVSQFTGVMRHLGRVLEADKSICSEDMLKDIRDINQSCESTFKEILNTIQSKKSSTFVALKWLFTKSQAMEIEVRLSAHKSTLQSMIQIVTLSKLGEVQSKYVGFSLENGRP